MISTIISALSGDKGALVSILLSFPVILFSLSFHEAAHGYVAYKMGDSTAKAFGRLTLNPLKHLDPIGTLVMFVFGFGWAKPVPINVRNFDDPRKGMAITGIAGPISNLLLGVISSVLYAVFYIVWVSLTLNMASVAIIEFVYYTALFFYVGAILNFGLMLFNMLPAPPFDGSRFFFYFLPKQWYFKVMKYERTIMIAILAIVFILARMGLSPISFISERLFSLITEPIIDLGFKIIM